MDLMKSQDRNNSSKDNKKQISSKIDKSVMAKSMGNIEALTKPTTAFTQALAREIVKNLSNISQMTTRPFRQAAEKKKKQKQEREALGEFPLLVDTSVLIDGRIVPIVNSGFMSGTFIIPQFVLNEMQFIADSGDIIRRTKGRRGLDVVSKLRGQKVNNRVKIRIVEINADQVKEVDHKLINLAKKWQVGVLTIDFNLAQLARAQGVKVYNINDLAQALKVALVPGEEIKIRISHPGKEREQGVGYLDDGTMIVVDNTKDKVGLEVIIVITKIHQTPAGQLFFAKLK